MEDEAPGWDAIDAALAPVVGSVTPQHWATWKNPLPDQNGIWGVSAYALEGHWMYVTYGLTELFNKVSDLAEVSGWGAELTMRLVRAAEPSAPEWPVRLLARLGELVFLRSTMFRAGTRLEIPDAEGALPPAVCWVDDPLLPPVDGPYGRFGFLATLGISMDVVTAMRAASTDAVIASVVSDNPELVTGGAGLVW